MTGASALTPGAFFIVRAWLDPVGGERYLDWLKNGHMAEVLREPGFLWGRLVRLDETDARGWPGWMMIYGLQDAHAIEAYQNSPSRQRFAAELAEIGDVFARELIFGETVFAVDAQKGEE